MAFEDSLIGNDDFDPRTATESLIRDLNAGPLPANLDPRMLNTRLARKLAEPPLEPPPVIEADLPEDSPGKQAKAGNVDFSAQGVEPATDVNASADFSSQAAEPPMIGPEAPKATNNSSWSDYPTEFGKGVAEGAKGLFASALKGAAATLDNGAPASEGLPEYDALGNPTGRTAEPTVAVAKKLVQDRTLYKTGQKVEDYGKEALAPKPGFEGSWTRDIGSGAGSMLAGIPIALIPGVGPAIGGAIWTAAGQGEAVEKAVHNKASQEQIEQAGLLGSIAGATDMVDALLPFVGTPGRALGFLKRVGLGAAIGALTESGQEGLQQLIQNSIAKGIYKPDQDLFEDVPRSMAIAAILGGAGGGISGAAIRGDRSGGQSPAPPPGGAQPGAGSPSGGPSSPEDIADFIRRAREGNPDQTGPSPDTSGPSGSQEQQFAAARDTFDGAGLDDILRQYGWDAASIDSMTDEQKVEQAIKAAAEKRAGTGKFAPDPGAERAASGSDTGPDTGPQQEGLKPRAPEGSHLRYAVLREYGYSDEDIDGMSEAQRKREFADAVAEGIKPGAAMTKHKPRSKPDGAESPQAEAGPAEQAQAPAAAPAAGAGQPESAITSPDDVKLDTGQNVQESRATLKAQQNQLIKGERDVQMFPQGTREMPLPPGMERVETPRGVFHFNPGKTSADKITAASAAGRENELLGLGSLSKEDVSQRDGRDVTIVERDAQGTEVRAAVGKESTAAQQLAEMEKGKSPGNTVSIEDPQQTLDGRNGKGTREERIDIRTARDVERAANAGATDYTPAQGEANNRKLGHAKWKGLPVSLEVAKGGTRKMVNPETGEGVEVRHDGAAYGYIPGTKGADGMHVDIYMGENPESDQVFVIDEIDRDTGKFRQHKVMAGFNSERDAFAAYVQTSSKSPETVGAISAMSVDGLKQWLSGDTTKALKPASSGPEMTGEAGSRAMTEAAGTAPKGSPDADLGGGAGVRPEATIPKTEKSFGQESGNPKKDSSRKSQQGADEPLSLLQFVASRGGLRPDPELNAIGLAGDHRVQIPGRKGFFGVIKATGDSLDNMREAAEEAGYLRGEHNKTSTVRDFLDALDTEMRGGAHRAEGEEGKQSKRERTSLKEASDAARDKAIAENVEAIKAEYIAMPDGLAEKAAVIMADEMVDLDTAVEMAAIREVNEDADYDVSENEITATYGEGAFDALQTRSAPEDGGTAASEVESDERSGEGEEAGADGTPDAAAREEGGEAEVTSPLEGLGPVEAYNAIRAEADRRYPPTSSKPDKKGKVEKYVSHEHTAFSNGAQGYEWDMAMPIHVKREDVIDDYLAGVRWKNGFPDDPAAMDESDTDQAEEEDDRSYYDSFMQPELSFEPASKDTLEWYARGLGIDVEARSRQWLIDALLEKGARGYQSGGIIAIPRTSRGAADALAPSELSRKIPDKLFEQFKAALQSHPDQIHTRAGKFETEESGATWLFRIGDRSQYFENAQPTSRFGYIDLTAYGDKVYISGGYNPKEQGRSYGSDFPAKYLNAFMRDFISKHPPTPGTERTEAGEQTVLPGAERVGQGEQAQRKADERLKPKVAQKPADDGLFGDSMDQADLLDAAKPKGIEAWLQGREGETYRQVMQSGTPKEAAELFARADRDYPDDSGVIDRLRRVIRTMRSPKAGLSDLDVALTQLRGTLDYIDADSGHDFDAEIEAALGEDADKVAPVDITRAAEIMAEKPGIEPAAAFGQAVIENAVEQGFITEQEAIDAYGPEVQELLESSREGASLRGGDLEQEGAEPDQIGTGDTAQAGVVPGGSEAGPAEGGADSAAQDAELDDAGRGQPDAERAAGGEAADESLRAAEAANDAAIRVLDLAERALAKKLGKSRLDNDDLMLDDPSLIKAQRDVGETSQALAEIEFNRAYDKLAPTIGDKYRLVRDTFDRTTSSEPSRLFYRERLGLPDPERSLRVIRNSDGAMMFALPPSGIPWNDTLREDLRAVQANEDIGSAAESALAAAEPQGENVTMLRPSGLPELAAELENATRDRPGSGKVVPLKEQTDGVQAPVPTGDAPTGAEAVQPTEPQRPVGELRQREGGGSEQAVPRADGERAEGSGRVSEGARGKRSDRAGNGRDAGLAEARADDAADGRAERAAKRAPDVEGENFVIAPGALDEGRGQKTKAIANINAIELANKIVAEGRPATAAEQAQLAKYVGWGGIKNAFPDPQGNYPDDTFANVGARLEAALTPEEYATARRSIQYAHYTAEDVVRAMWGAVEKMGFKGGQVFEPGMGVGNFAGMMPTDVAANTTYNGIELDHVTARIAKLLYPKWGVRQDDFTKTKLPENNYDLVIGNPPFADVAIKSDPKYKQGFLLHDYFFAKSLDAVRPGGLLAFVTSAGTMNKMDTAARDYLADRADMVGAIRLPGDAFLKNAGTAVTTDIIFLRKRLPGDVPGDRSWTEVKIVTLPGMDGKPEQGYENRWFAENPEMVLGNPDFNDRLYPGRYSVKSRPGESLAANLAKAMERLPADIMSDWQNVNADQHEQDFGTTEKKEGTYYVGPDGNLHQVVDGVGRRVGQRGKGVENGRTAADIERIKGLIPVRDALRAVYAADLKGDTGNAARARTQLNKAYDAFVEKHGPINKAVIQTRRPNVIQMENARAEAREEARYADAIFREGSFDATPLLDAKTPLSVIARKRQEMRDDFAARNQPFDEGDFDPDEVPDVIIDKRPNVDPFMDDPESYRLRAIERYDEGTGQGHKSPVFTENVITREVTPKINSVNDALLYSLSQYGRVNVPAMAELMKQTEAEVIEGLGDQVFKVPGTSDTYVTRDEYLSGNVRKKLDLAAAAAQRNPDFRRNVDALEAAQPMPLAPSQIHASLGMPWIPQAEIEAFAREAMGMEKIRVRYQPKLASWTVSGETDTVAASTTWGTNDRRAPALLEDALNRQNPKIYDKVRDPGGRESSVLNVAKTEAAQDKVNAMRETFAGWLWSDEKRADRLASFYNENYNNLVVREYDGSYLTTPSIASSWSWRPHQKRVISRIIQSGNTYIAHAVGAGKTSEYIGAIMEMRRLGLVRKPMVAVPNHMLAQFTKEWYEQYPTARLAIADDKRFHTDRRKQFIANVAMEDLDAIIITHSSFGMIPISDKFQNGVIQKEIAQYRELLAELKQEGGDSRITRSRVEKQIERLEQRLVGKTGRKDATFTFEEMGVDHLTIDEAHLFRKLDFTTKMSNLKGVSPEGSGMAWDLYIKSLYLDTIRPGRGLLLGSGTPITNTMAELYTLSRYMQPQALAERGLEKFDAWAGAFGESVAELEQDAAGNYKPVSRFAKFVNVAELSAMVRQVMDVVTSKQLEQYVTRPQIKGGKRTLHLAEKSRALTRYQEGLAARMVAIQNRKGPPSKGDDIMLSVINDGRHAAIDMRLAGGDQSEIPSKLEMLVENVYREWEATKRQKFFKVGKDGKYETKPATTGPATQLIFANLGLSGARGFAVPDYIRSELVRRGVPKDEIAFIYDYKSATAKQRLFNDMNEGKKRILIGSVAKMGVGTNVQRRLSAIHNLDPLWYPSDDEQRNGRGIRQGNMNPEIGINDYATKGTYDSTMWGMMAKKGRFIEGFFEGDPSLRDMEDLGEASQYEQAKALTTNDPRLIVFTEMKQELEKAQRRKSAFENDVYNTRQRRARAKAEIEHYSARIEETKQDIKQRVDTRGDAFKGMVGKESFDKRTDFADALFKKLDDLSDGGTLSKPVKVAEVGGFPIYATVHRSNLLKNEVTTDVFMQLNGPDRSREISYETSSLGTVRSIESALSSFESDLAEYKNRLARAEKFFAESEAKATAKFAGDAEIQALAQKVRDMEAELKADAAPAPAPTVEAAPEGEELANVAAPPRFTPVAESQTAEIERMLTQIVRAIAGDIPTVEFVNGTIKIAPPPGYGSMKSSGEALGTYRLGSALLRLALINDADAMMTSAFHESYHHVEDRLQTPAERELMKRETPRMREWIKGGKTGLSDAQIDGLAGYEVRAIAFQIYGSDRIKAAPKAGEGLHIGARRWFDKLLDLLQRLRNGLKGLGFKTYNDVFADTFTGKMAARADRGTGGIDPADLAAMSDIFTGVADRVQAKTGWDFTELRVQVQDKFIRVRKAQESVGGVPTSRNTYQAESLYYGRTGERLERLEKDHFDPLVKDMNERGITLPQMNDYLYAKHAPERNARMDEINHPELDPGGRDLRGRGSGMSDEEAAQIMADITDAGRMADFEAVERRVRQIIDDTRASLAADGLISDETADAWANQYEYYVPLRGFDEATEDESIQGRGQGFDTRAAESQRAFGRLSKAAGPLPYVMMQAEMAIVRGEKNKVGNTMLRFVRSNPDAQRWTVNKAPTRKAIDPRTGLVTKIADSNWRNRPDVFITKIGGEPMLIQFHGAEGERLVRALKNIGTSNLNGVLRMMHTLTTTMSRLATQWNPNFTAPNFARDVGEAFINMQAQDQQHFMRQFSKHLIPAIGGAFHALRGAQGGRYAAAFREFDKAGGRIRFFGLENPEDITKNVTKRLRRLEGGVLNSFKDAGEAAANGFDIVNGSIENATRLAAYMAARDVGMSAPDAAMLARNMTVDFNKKGELGTALNALYMFINASIQGTVRIGTALTHKKVRRAAYGLIAIGALSAMLAAMSGGDDDADENYYAKVPHYIRDKHLVIMWPKGWGNDGKYVKIPLPYGFAPFFVLGERLAMVSMGKDKPGEAAYRVFASILDAFNPLGEEGTLWSSFLPSVMRPGQHIATNKNWNEQKLYPDEQWTKHKPDSENSFRSNSEFSKEAARQVNSATGGSPYKSGWFDWHPGSIDHTMEAITGGLGKFVGDVIKTGGNFASGEPFDATKAPILRRFYGTANDAQADQHSYYRDREEARKSGGQSVRDARRDSARGLNKDAADSFLREAKPRGEQIFKTADEQMKPLRERRARLEANKEMDSDVKRAAMKEIEQQMRDVQNRARKQYRELGQGQ